MPTQPMNPTDPFPTSADASPLTLTDDRAASVCGEAPDSAADLPADTLRTGDFLAAVRRANPGCPLEFHLDGDPLVGPGYHVTEVKAATYETMDCGGAANRWKETIIQLWNPGDEPENGHMAAGKFLAIYDRVAAHVPVSATAELRFEYGDCSRPASAYPVASLKEAGGRLLVDLRAPVVTCKAIDRERDQAARGNRGTVPRCCG